MRHVRQISTARPKEANQFQDIICVVAGIAAAVIQAFGGASPIAEYIDGKCAFTPPGS